MKVYRAPRQWDVAAALLFTGAGYFASLAASNPPDWVTRSVLSVLAGSWPAVPLLLFLLLLLLGARSQQRAHLPAALPTPLEEQYADFIFHYASASAASIRLVGAHDESFPAERVRTYPVDNRYELPNDFLATRAEVLGRLSAEAKKSGQMFFDGTAARLVDYTASPTDASEDKHLFLRLGPVSWHDYSVVKWNLDFIKRSQEMSRLAAYIDLDKVALAGVIRESKLANMLCTATTIVTEDEYVTYSRRSARVSTAAAMMTCSVAENIHFEKDGVTTAPLPGALPLPFNTVARGVEEELSPAVAETLRAAPQLINLLGLDFDLEGFHPDLLFLVRWPGSLADLQQHIASSPGRDFVEGSLAAVPLRRPDVEHLLLQPGWVPAGKASVIRSLEFLNAARVRRTARTM